MTLTADFDVVALTNRTRLREYVHRVLCERDRLDPGQTPMTEAVVTRRGKPCGLAFEIEGPRLLRTTAIWAGDEARILFYDSTGVRFTEVRLSESPTLEE